MRLSKPFASLTLCALAIMGDAVGSNANYVYRDPQHVFEATFPQKPVAKQIYSDTANGRLRISTAVTGNEKEGLSVILLDMPKTFPMAGKETQFINLYAAKLTAKCKAAPIKNSAEQYCGRPARHLILSRYTNEWAEGYILVQGQHIYTVMAGATSLAGLKNPIYKKFFASFKVLN